MPTTLPRDPLLDDLVADLSPVRLIRPRQGGLLVVAAVTLCATAVAALWGFRSDVVALAPANIVILRSAALLLVGTATLAAALISARPGVGGRAQGWQWAVLAAGAIPVAALWGALHGEARLTDVMSNSVPWCFAISLSSAAVIATTITAWLRRGAVTEPNRAAWLTGIAAGALGTFAYNLHCPSSTIFYTGLWYTLTVMISAVASRLILPRLLRW
jgi:hypothetical protein